MSSRPAPRSTPSTGRPERAPMTIPRIGEMKRSGETIVMVTAYDHPSGVVAEEAGVDVILVGDSAAMVVLGHDATTPVGMNEMLMLAAAVRRGAHTPLLIGDMPFGSYEASNELAVENAQRFVKEAGCDAVKLERGGTSVSRAQAIVDAGIPVMGHVGLTPQTATALGGYKAQGRTAARAAGVARTMHSTARQASAAARITGARRSGSRSAVDPRGSRTGDAPRSPAPPTADRTHSGCRARGRAACRRPVGCRARRRYGTRRRSRRPTRRGAGR